MKPRICLLWINGDVEEIHHFNLPSSNEVGFYRQTVSYNAFRERSDNEYDRHYEKRQPIAKRAQLSEVDTVSWWLKEFKDKPQCVFHHDSLWDMYKAIGYDYKKQRFL